MKYEVRRGETVLGSFRETSPVMHRGKNVGVSGVLLVEPGVTLSGVMQTTIPLLPGNPVVQSPIAPLEPIVRTGQSRSSQVVELQTTDPENPWRVPPDQQLHILTSDSAIATRSISLQQVPIPLGEGGRLGLPEDATSCWMISFVRLDAVG